MSITPNDILDKQFPVSFRGYNREEVDKFLEAVAQSMTAVIKEMNALKDEVAAYRVKLESLQEREEEFRKALTTAHTFAEEMKAQARRDADLMLEQARMDAERMIADAHQEAIQLEDSIRGLRRIQREAVFKIRSSIEGYLHLLDDAMLPPEELDNLLSAASSDVMAIQGRGSTVLKDIGSSPGIKDASENAEPGSEPASETSDSTTEAERESSPESSTDNIEEAAGKAA